jgi:hypothetical protein
MSDHPAVVRSAYGSPDSLGRDDPLPGFDSVNGYSGARLHVPAVGVHYRVDPSKVPGLKQPELLSVYPSNNGFVGKEWIAPMLPDGSYHVDRTVIARDQLHRTRRIDFNPSTEPDEVLAMTLEAVALQVERIQEFGHFITALVAEGKPTHVINRAISDYTDQRFE